MDQRHASAILCESDARKSAPAFLVISCRICVTWCTTFSVYLVYSMLCVMRITVESHKAPSCASNSEEEKDRKQMDSLNCGVMQYWLYIKMCLSCVLCMCTCPQLSKPFHAISTFSLKVPYGYVYQFASILSCWKSSICSYLSACIYGKLGFFAFLSFSFFFPNKFCALWFEFGKGMSVWFLKKPTPVDFCERIWYYVYQYFHILVFTLHSSPF